MDLMDCEPELTIHKRLNCYTQTFASCKHHTLIHYKRALINFYLSCRSTADYSRIIFCNKVTVLQFTIKVGWSTYLL